MHNNARKFILALLFFSYDTFSCEQLQFSTKVEDDRGWCLLRPSQHSAQCPCQQQHAATKRPRCWKSLLIQLRGGGQHNTQPTDIKQSRRKDRYSEDSSSQVADDDMHFGREERPAPPRVKRNRERHDKALRSKVDRYLQKYGISPRPLNPLPLLLRKAAQQVDPRTRLKIDKERFEEEQKELESIQKQLEEDSKKRLSRYA